MYALYNYLSRRKKRVVKSFGSSISIFEYVNILRIIQVHIHVLVQITSTSLILYSEPLHILYSPSCI